MKFALPSQETILKAAKEYTLITLSTLLMAVWASISSSFQTISRLVG